MEYVRILVFIASLLVCCIAFSALAAVVSIANPLVLLFLFTFGFIGIFFMLDFLDSTFKSYY